jgi:hypothetical protein
MRRLSVLLLLTPLATGCAAGPSKADLDDEVRRLCAIDGGVKVYETVTLPAERFDKYGNVRIPLKRSAKPGDDYFYEGVTSVLKPGDPDGAGTATVFRMSFKVYRAEDNKLLGEDVTYVRRGGDLPGPWHPSSFTCPSITKTSGVEKQIFLKAGERG